MNIISYEDISKSDNAQNFSTPEGRLAMNILFQSEEMAFIEINNEVEK